MLMMVPRPEVEFPHVRDLQSRDFFSMRANRESILFDFFQCQVGRILLSIV